MTKITGLDAVIANLKRASVAIKEILPGPLTAAGNVLAEELRSRTPDRTGALADAIVVATPRTNQNGGSVRVGFSEEPSADGAAFDKIALWLEFGHEEVERGKQNGVVAAHPFMRPTAVAAASDAVNAFADALRAEMEHL